MVLTRQALSEYDARIQKLGDAAYDTVYRRVTQFMKRFPGASVERVRDFTIESVSYAVSVYGDAASTCAADLYDEMAEASGAKLPPAILDTSDVSGYIEKEVRYQAGKYIAGKGEEFASAVAAKATDQVSRRANETMRRNAKRDGLRYARVPMGGETCTFCIMLASRGFVYKSAKTAGEGNHFHAHCRCKVVPQFDKRGRGTKVEGYDPDELLDRWDKFKQIDEMRGADGKPVSEFDRRVLKIAYADKRIDYEKVFRPMSAQHSRAQTREVCAIAERRREQGEGLRGLSRIHRQGRRGRRGDGVRARSIEPSRVQGHDTSRGQVHHEDEDGGQGREERRREGRLDKGRRSG